MESIRWIKTEDMVVGGTYRVGESTTDFRFLGNKYFTRPGLGTRPCGISASYNGIAHTLAPRKTIVEVTNTKEEIMNKLYEISSTKLTGTDVIYGHKLAVDSSGNWVMEIKGTGEVRSFSKSQVTEVVPYSVSIKFGGTSSEYNYLAVKGDWVVGDLVILNSGGSTIATITGTDTKSNKATKWITGFKLYGVVVKSGE